MFKYFTQSILNDCVFITFLDLLSRYPPEMNVTWHTVIRHSSSNYSGTVSRIPGHLILPLYEKNHTIKIFETLSASLKRENMSKTKFLEKKMDLFSEYGHPKPFPKDMFLRLKRGTPDSAYVILGQEGTGEKRIKSLLVRKMIKIF